MASLFNASKGLVGALMGGDEIEAAARSTQELQNLSVGKGQADFARKVEEARMKTAQRIEQDNMESSLRAVLPPGMAENAGAYASLARARGGGFSDLAGGLDKFQIGGMRGQVAPALEAQGFTPANALLGAMAGKPIENVKIQGGYQLQDRFGAAPTIQATPGELADIVNTNRRTANVGVSRSGGGGGKQIAYTTPPNNRLTAALGGEGNKPDPTRTQEFLAWQQQNAAVDPAYRDGDFALAQYIGGNNAMRAETNDFGAGEVRLPASVNPGHVEMLSAVLEDRKRNGLPDLSRAQQIDAYKQIKLKGGYSEAPAKGPKKTFTQRADAKRDSLLGALGLDPAYFSGKKPADKAKGNAGVEASGMPEAAPTGAITRAQYAALPSGAKFIAPDGTERIKP